MGCWILSLRMILVWVCTYRDKTSLAISELDAQRFWELVAEEHLRRHL
jgi:hypothetical protein